MYIIKKGMCRNQPQSDRNAVRSQKYGVNK